MWLCKRDLSKECEGKYRDCTDCVLDKISAEIENYKLSEDELTEMDEDSVKCGMKIAYEIIDKYKADFEPQERSDKE